MAEDLDKHIKLTIFTYPFDYNSLWRDYVPNWMKEYIEYEKRDNRVRIIVLVLVVTIYLYMIYYSLTE